MDEDYDHYECSECGKTIYEDGRGAADYISYVNSGMCCDCEDERENSVFDDDDF